jgi:hypothetical protein
MNDKVTHQVGDIVDITIRGAIVRYQSEDGGDLEFEYRSELGVCEARVALDSDAVTVERGWPAEWPPRPGDVWQEVDGALWFAQSLGGSQMVLVPAVVRGETSAALPAYVQETFGPLTLVRREGGAR